MRGVQALSALDLLFIPVIAGTLAAGVAQGARTSDSTRVALEVLSECVAAVLLARWLRGASARRRPVLASLAVASILPGAMLLKVIGGVLHGAHGVPAHLRADLWPFAPRTEITLRGEGNAPVDAARIARRLRRMHHRTDIVSAQGDSIRLRVALGDASPGALLVPVLRPGTLGFYRVSDDQTAVSPTAGELPGLSTRRLLPSERTVYEGPTPESLAAVVARSERVPGAITRIECERRDDPVTATRCFALRLDAALSVTGLQVARAQVVSDSETGSPQVLVEFTPAGTLAFAALSRACRRNLLAIVVNDQIHSTPIVTSEITGGHATLGMGDLSTAATDAHALAAALNGGALAGRWQLATVGR